METKPVVWSYSSVSLFKQCPYKYYREKVKKDIQQPASDAMNYGKEVHKACEEFVKFNTPLPAQFSRFERMMLTIRDLKGAKYCEHKMGLSADMSPCKFFDKNVWHRSVVDLLVVNGESARLIDYKTSKSSNYADTSQLQLQALSVFKHFPEVKRIKAGLLFLEVEDFVKSDYDAGKTAIYWEPWLTDVAKLQKCMEEDLWPKRPNFTCRGWCGVTDCEHWTEKTIKVRK